jgi:chromate transporter
LLALGSPLAAWLAGLYRAGALVFGGGHVVLPLLQTLVVPTGVMAADDFMAGYGLAQALPGPLFTFAAFLGALMPGRLGGWTGGVLALVVIFLPAYLLVVGALPFWDRLRRYPVAQSVLGGVNAGVVGVLLAALYDPVWVGAIRSRADFALALLCFALLVLARWSAVWVVALAAVLGGLLAAV